MRKPEAVVFWEKQERGQINGEERLLDAPSKDEDERDYARYEEENAHAIGYIIVCRSGSRP